MTKRRPIILRTISPKYLIIKNVFNNIKADLNLKDFVKISPNEKQNIIQLGDILFTNSSETKNEVGMSCVVTDEPLENIFLNSFCFGFRFNDKSLISPEFSKFLFRDEAIRQQIIKTANGVTRFNISKKKLQAILIPLPPLEIQNTIVEILDKFTELERELESRKKQYEYYRNLLLSKEELEKRTRKLLCDTKGNKPEVSQKEFKDSNNRDISPNTQHNRESLVKMVSLGEVCDKVSNIKWKEKQNKDFIYVDLNSVNRDNCKIETTKIINHKNAPSRAQQIIKKGDVILEQQDQH